MSEDLEVASECLGIFRDMRVHREIRGLVTDRSLEEVRSFEVTAWPATGGGWKLTREDGSEDEYGPDSGMRLTGPDGLVETAPDRKISKIVKLAYPQEFDVWGGRTDEWYLANAAIVESNPTLIFENKDSAKWEARLHFVCDKRLCLAYEELRRDTGTVVRRLEFTRIDYPFKPG